MLNFLRRKPKIKIDKDEAAALLFHYHKHGIPPAQTAAKALETRLCKFVGEEPIDNYTSPCEGAHHEGEIQGENNVRSRLRDLRRENEVVGGDQSIVNAVRLIDNWI